MVLHYVHLFGQRFVTYWKYLWKCLSPNVILSTIKYHVVFTLGIPGEKGERGNSGIGSQGPRGLPGPPGQYKNDLPTLKETNCYCYVNLVRKCLLYLHK